MFKKPTYSHFLRRRRERRHRHFLRPRRRSQDDLLVGADRQLPVRARRRARRYRRSPLLHHLRVAPLLHLLRAVALPHPHGGRDLRRVVLPPAAATRRGIDRRQRGQRDVPAEPHPARERVNPCQIVAAARDQTRGANQALPRNLHYTGRGRRPRLPSHILLLRLKDRAATTATAPATATRATEATKAPTADQLPL